MKDVVGKDKGSSALSQCGLNTTCALRLHSPLTWKTEVWCGICLVSSSNNAMETELKEALEP